MISSPTLSQESLIEAILTLKTNNSVAIKEAESFLKNVSKYEALWSLSISLLTMQTTEMHIIFWGSKFLKNKIQYDFAQLQPDQIQNLAKTIIELVLLHKDREKATRSQIILAFVYFFMQTHQLFPDLLKILTDRLVALPNWQNIFIEVLEFIPDEAENDHIVIEDDKRENYIKFLRQDIYRHVLTVLHNIAVNRAELAERTCYYMLKCLNSWLYFYTDGDVMATLVDHAAFHLALDSLSSSELNEKGSQCLGTAIRALDPQRDIQLATLIAKRVFDYIPECDKAIEEQVYDDVDGYTAVFIEFGKLMIGEFVINKSEAGLSLLNYLVRLTANTELENVEEMTSFWYKFCKYLRKRIDDPIKKAEAIQFFFPMLIELVRIAGVRMRLSNEHLLQTEEADDTDVEDINGEFELKNKYRYLLKDMLKDVTELLTFERVFEVIAESIKQDIAALQAENSLSKWGALEAHLYCVSTVIEEVNDDNIGYIREMLTLILQIPIPMSKIKNTAISIIGKSSAFLTKSGDIISNLFKFLAGELTNKKTMKFASKAVGDLCRYNKNFVLENVEEFMLLYDQMSENEEILVGLVTAISSYKDDKYMEKYLKKIFSPFATRLALTLQTLSALTPTEPVKENVIVEIKRDLNYITTIMRVLPEADEELDNASSRITLEITKEMWPVIEYFFDKFQANAEIVEKLNRYVKHTMRCLGKAFTDFLLPFFNIVTKYYQLYPISSYLYSVEFSVTVFSRYGGEYEGVLKTIFDFMSQRTFQELPKLESLEENPELTEDFFGMLTRYLRYCPKIIISSDSLPILLKLSETGIGIKHKEAAKALYSFIEILFQLSYETEGERLGNLQNALHLVLRGGYGELYIKRLIEAIVDYTPSSIREYMEDILIAAIEAFPQDSLDWFNKALQTVPQDILTANEKISFVQKLTLHDKKTKEPTSKLLEQFASRCKQSMLRHQQIDDDPSIICDQWVSVVHPKEVVG